MNVFFQELRLRRKSQIWWGIAIIIFMVMSVVKFDTLAQDASMSEALLKQFPTTVQAIFGMTGLNLTTLSGYFGVLFIYVLVILSIHAGMLGAGLLADEERDRTTEFLLVKPRARSVIVTQKLLAGFVCIVLLWGVVVVTTWVATLSLSNTGEFMRDFWHFMIALGLTQVAVYFLGSFAAALTKNPKLPTRIVASIVFVSYLLFALVKLAPSIEVFKYASLFCYFDAATIINNGTLQPLSIVVFSALALVSLAGTYVFYRRRDVNV